MEQIENVRSHDCFAIEMDRNKHVLIRCRFFFSSLEAKAFDVRIGANVAWKFRLHLFFFFEWWSEMSFRELVNGFVLNGYARMQIQLIVLNF